MKKWKKQAGILLAIIVLVLSGKTNIYAEETQKETEIVSFLGDSITTYSGYTGYEERANYYRDEIMPVDATWWMQILNDNNWKLGINDSIGGSRVSWDGETEDDLHFNGREYYMASENRIRNLGKNGTPDKIFIFGGMNDILAQDTINLGSVEEEYAYGKIDDFADAYYTMICEIKENYPNAEIVCLIPYHTIYSLDSEVIAQNTEDVAAIIQDICDKENIKVIDLREIHLEGQNDMETSDYIHPNESGMKKMSDFIIKRLTYKYGRVEENGEYYFYDENGKILTNKMQTDSQTGNIWYFDENGHQVFDSFVRIENNVYYFDEYGNRYSGKELIDENGDKHYFREDGTMIYNDWYFDGTWTYYLQYDGTPMKDRLTYHPDGEHIIYLDKDGHEVFNNFQYCPSVGYTCYFDSQGYIYKDQITFVGDKVYYLNANGAMEQSGWFQYANHRDYGYANPDGTLKNTEFSYDAYGRVVYYQWNGMVARGLIFDGVYYYNMNIRDGHYQGYFKQM